jgi:protein MpaA
VGAGRPQRRLTRLRKPLPAVGAALLAVATASSAHASRVVALGRSVEGRAIKAVVIGPRDAQRNVLVVGNVHGNELAGITVVRALRERNAAPAGTALWLVRSFNPDGLRARTRQNARGVDLNRQAPYRWRHLPRGTFYSGPRPLSEPESRAAIRLVRRIRPAVSIWYHQAARLVVSPAPVARRYARAVGLPFGRLPGDFPGSITNWQNHVQPRNTAFVVELAAGPLSRRAVRRHVRAVVSAARGRDR